MREEFKLNHLCCLWLLYHDSEMAEVNISLSVSLETYSSYRNGANMGTMLTSYYIQLISLCFCDSFWINAIRVIPLVCPARPLQLFKKVIFLNALS